jgi:hypothetical protein
MDYKRHFKKLKLEHKHIPLQVEFVDQYVINDIQVKYSMEKFLSSDLDIIQNTKINNQSTELRNKELPLLKYSIERRSSKYNLDLLEMEKRPTDLSIIDYLFKEFKPEIGPLQFHNLKEFIEKFRNPRPFYYFEPNLISVSHKEEIICKANLEEMRQDNEAPKQIDYLDDLTDSQKEKIDGVNFNLESRIFELIFQKEDFEEFSYSFSESNIISYPQINSLQWEEEPLLQSFLDYQEIDLFLKDNISHVDQVIIKSPKGEKCRIDIEIFKQDLSEKCHLYIGTPI